MVFLDVCLELTPNIQIRLHPIHVAQVTFVTKQNEESRVRLYCKILKRKWAVTQYLGLQIMPE